MAQTWHEPPQRRPNVSEEVSQYIRQLIFGGDLRQNQRVPQDEIAATLGVSRLPVREALISLENEGLVYNVARRGAFVAPIADIDVQDHYEIYGLAHGIAGARTARTAAGDSVTELRRLHEAMCAERNVAKFDELNWQFHRLINVVGGSRRLKSILRTLFRSLPRNFFAEVPGATAIAIRGHADILDAIERGDADAAARACHLHLRHESESIVAMMAAEDFWDRETARPEAAP